MTEGPVCAIDCGTNSTRLLIVAASGEAIRREMRITRLGEGVDSTGSLSEEACARTLDVLASYRSLMEEAGVVGGRLAATSAARDAANGPAFLEAASEVAGVEAEILSGEEEGRLSFAGAMDGLEPAAGDDLVLDIGGGSTEIVISRDGILRSHSMQLGCVRVSERELLGDPPTTAEIVAACRMADEEIDRAIELIPELGSLMPARARRRGPGDPAWSRGARTSSLEASWCSRGCCTDWASTASSALRPTSSTASPPRCSRPEHGPCASGALDLCHHLGRWRPAGED